MCTAVSYKGSIHCFGRNLDLDYSYEQSVVVVPKNFSLCFRKENTLSTHYAFIGTAYVTDNYPLMYDGTNEYGLSVCGLNFPQNACYFSYRDNMINITPFEFIPWILSLFKTIDEVKDALLNMNILDENFSDQLSLTPLHWMISDREKSIVAEPTKNGLKVYDNPVHVLTNNPEFSQQLFLLNNCMSFSNKNPENNFSNSLTLDVYSLGMGALGLKGDWSSPSRFQRASFVRENSPAPCSDIETVSQFFHILKSVAHPAGVVVTDKGRYQKTVYSSCCDTNSLKFYYTTYENSRISCVDMKKENLQGDKLSVFPMIHKENIYYHN